MSKTIDIDKEALQLAGRFALPPNSLGYCGHNSAPEKFKNCFINEKCDGVQEELTKFIVFHPYLQTIADIFGMNKFSYDVVEAYCLGNDKLKQAKPEHYNLLLRYFLEQGVPSWFVDELRANQPKKFIPMHLFQVLHVGVGKASGAVPFNLDSINNCMVRWGEVTKIIDNELTAEFNSIYKPNGIYDLTILEETVVFVEEVVKGIKVGDYVAIHWNQVIKILTDKEVTNLEYWTKEILDTVN